MFLHYKMFTVFVILPERRAVYTIEDRIYDAGNLELLDLSPANVEYSKVFGYSTTKFGVKPQIIYYENDEYELIYAPLDKDQVYTHDGVLAKHMGKKIISSSSISIPYLYKGMDHNMNALPIVALDNPKESSLDNYYIMASDSVEYNKLIPNWPEDFISVQNPKIVKEVVKEKDNNSEELKKCNNELDRMSKEINCLKDQISILYTRLYQTGTPIQLPEQLDVNGEIYKQVSEDDMKSFTDTEYRIVPELQGYAGSHRGEYRILLSPKNKVFARCYYNCMSKKFLDPNKSRS